MRTRFLNVDYFSHFSNEEEETLIKDLDFLRLPIPQIIPPSNLFCNQSQFLIILLLSSDPIVCSEIHDGFQFQIDKPLSQFFSDVLPQRIDFPNADLPFICSPKRNAYSIEGSRRDSNNNNNNGDEQRNFGSEPTSDDRFAEGDENDVVGEEKDKRSFLQFETPELDFFLEESACVFGNWDRPSLCEVPEIEIPVDFETTIPYPCTISEAVYSVEDMTSDYNMEQKSSCFVEATGLVQDITCKYPILEVNEIDLGFYTGSSTEEEFHLLFQNIGFQQWNGKDNLVADGQELLGSISIDNLEFLSEHRPLDLYVEPEPELLNLVLEMDYITLKEIPDIKGNSTKYQEASHVVFFPVMTPTHFQEFQILDLDSFQSLEVFFSLQKAIESKTCDSMFTEDMIGNLYESTVSYELALVDDSFKSLPVPVLSDDKAILSVSATVQKILADLKPHPPSTSDGIYLDWHLLQEDRCNSYICWNMSEEIKTYYSDSELETINGGMVTIDFYLSDNTPDRSNMLTSKEILIEPLPDVAPIKLLKFDGQKPGTGKPDTNAEKDPILLKSMSQFNDLNFFLNPRKSTSKRNTEAAMNETLDTKVRNLLYPSGDSISVCSSDEVKMQQLEIEVHQVKLSDHILGIISNFQKCYLAILGNETVLKNKPVVDSFVLLHLPKRKLMEWIKQASLQQTISAHKDESLKAFVALYVIKQMAWYLCFYGIHTTHLYLGNLCRSLEYMKPSLSFLLSLIENAQRKVDDEITESHPSLSIIQGILRSVASQAGSKVLIVAAKVFWWPLKRLLTAMNISFHEPQNILTRKNQGDAWDSDNCSNFVLDNLLHSDCFLISQEHLSASFPLNKFTIILEYGGSYGSSRMPTVPMKLGGLPRVHFMKVELEDFSVAKALCEGVDTQNTDLLMEASIQSLSSKHDSIRDKKLEDLLNFVPTEEECTYVKPLEPADSIQVFCLPVESTTIPFAMEHKRINSTPTYPDIIVVVNTQSFDKEMLISRRSSYQKILSLEKGGMQVLEREVNYPVDLIFSAGLCLVWYDCKSIGRKAADIVEASSCIPLYVENIATNVLTSLSFAFSECILVFEGESRFLTAVMESSDGLYAAAASLGIDIQLFFSYSSELTDEIVFSCIDCARKVNKGQCPKMLESETLAESFLTRFPSINPLSAHAILSSGGVLIEFLEWPPDRRIREIGKYHVPDESMSLFSALCSYGELEDSRSGMTECSSVSSADSRSKTESQRKKQKGIVDPHTIEMSMDDLPFKPFNQSTEVNLKPSTVSKPYQSWNFSESQKVDGIDISVLCPNDELFGQNECNTSRMNSSCRKRKYRPEKVNGDLKCEFIDLTNSPILDEDFFSFEETTSIPFKGKDTENGNSASTRRLSYGTSNRPSFPASTEINADINIWSSLEDHDGKLEQDMRQTNIDSRTDSLSLNCRRVSFEENLMPGTTSNTSRLSFQEKTSRPYGETPLSNAIHSSRMQQMSTGGVFFEEKMMPISTSNTNRLSFQENFQPPYGLSPLSNAIHSSGLPQGSPWTIEFLNKIREKRRIQQKSLLGNTSDHYGYSDGIGKSAKRKSPSIIDHYKYKGSSKSNKIIKQKWQKLPIQPSSSSKIEKASASLQTWTPIDKRARQVPGIVTWPRLSPLFGQVYVSLCMLKVLNEILDSFESGEKFYLYMGRGPSSEAVRESYSLASSLPDVTVGHGHIVNLECLKKKTDARQETTRKCCQQLWIQWLREGEQIS